MPLEVVVNNIQNITFDATSQERKPIPIITTATITTVSIIMPQKRRRSPQVGELHFHNVHDIELFFRVGKIKSESSACVIKENLDDKYPIVYEEWQKHKTNKQTNLSSFRCRRQRGLRTKSRRVYVVTDKCLRGRDNKIEYIGCECPARYGMRVLPDGTVNVKFYGYHNHDVQKEYAVRFLNPIQTCFRIREIVDSKLLAGVERTHSILTSVLSEMFKYRQSTSTPDSEVLRCYHMAFALMRQQIRNRRDQLGLNLDKLAHK